jgi:DNA-binding GntR family transcriptional regulator
MARPAVRRAPAARATPAGKTTAVRSPRAARAPVAAAAPPGDVEQRIYDSVFEGVMGHRLPPGTKLPEQALCALFEASRSTVRKVLQRLAHDHIVELRPNKGAIVASPTPEETRQIFEARRAVEAAIVRLAARHATREDVADLRRQLAREHEAVHRFDQPAWSRLASTFHLRLAQLARNPILERYLVELVSRCSLIVALYEAPGNASCEHDEHGALVDCIARGDAEGAVRLMGDHLTTLERHVELRQHTGSPSLGRMLGLA